MTSSCSSADRTSRCVRSPVSRCVCVQTTHYSCPWVLPRACSRTPHQRASPHSLGFVYASPRPSVLVSALLLPQFMAKGLSAETIAARDDLALYALPWGTTCSVIPTLSPPSFHACGPAAEWA